MDLVFCSLQKPVKWTLTWIPQTSRFSFGLVKVGCGLIKSKRHYIAIFIGLYSFLKVCPEDCYKIMQHHLSCLTTTQQRLQSCYCLPLLPGCLCLMSWWHFYHQYTRTMGSSLAANGQSIRGLTEETIMGRLNTCKIHNTKWIPMLDVPGPDSI